MKRSTKNKIFVIVAILLAGVLLVAFGNITGGFQNLHPDDWVIVQANSDNLYQSFQFKGNGGVLATGEYGVSVKLADNNIIKVSGVAERAEAIEIATYTLEAGKTYVFDSSLNNGTNGTIYMALSSGSQTWSCYSEPVVITVSANTLVTLKLMIADEYDVGNVSLKPILCEGTSADDVVSFYK